MTETSTYWDPRICLREPIPEIFEAAGLLKRATDAHLANERAGAEALIRQADNYTMRMWWSPTVLPKAARVPHANLGREGCLDRAVRLQTPGGAGGVGRGRLIALVIQCIAY